MKKQKIDKENPWDSIRAAIHDKLRYKKAKKKKLLSNMSNMKKLANNVSNILTGVRISFGIAALIVFMVGAYALPTVDEDWNIPDINTPNSQSINPLKEIPSGDITISATTPTRLTYNGAYDRQPAWSPDGLWISFVSTRSGNWDIWKVSRYGESSGIKRLTYYGGFDLEPNWNPSNKIIFAAGSGQGYEDVYKMNSDGTGRTRLTTAFDFDEYADWSPDGTKIVYSSVGGNPGGAKQIWIMNADGTNKHKINNEYGIQPAWSPDGKKIAFKCYRGGYNICLMNADGTNLKQLTSETADTHDPDWTPDSKQIIYASKRDGDFEIYLMNADGTNKRQLTSNVGISDDFPSFSRDGKYIVFASTRSGNQEIWIMPAPTLTTSTGISVISPNAGEIWQHGTYKTIKWTSSGSPGSYVRIELLKSGILNRVISSSTPNDGSYTWLIPSTQTLGSDYKIRITSTSNSIYKDMSDNYFRIY